MRDRELKFRAWDKKNKRMLCSEDLYRFLITFNGTIVKMEGSIKISEKQDEVSAVIKDKNLIPMQFTGLKDKNGKESYFEDIVKLKTRDNFYYVIRKDDFGIPVFMANGYDESRPFTIIDFRDYFSEMSKNDFEIVGDVYQNPDLIEK